MAGKDAPSSTPFASLTSLAILDTPIRFVLLYLTTLFSLDPWTAAQRSPYSLRTSSPSLSTRRSQREWGNEGDGIGLRLDPGGPTNPRRRGGFVPGGNGGSLDVTPCPSCMRPEPRIHH